MAELKIGTTVGGAPVWNQGNFQMFPAGDTVLYKTFKIYTEHDKPQATDNDFVSKALGGTYLSTVNFDKPITIKASTGSLSIGASTNALYQVAIKTPGIIGFETSAGSPFILMDPVTDPTNYRLTVMGRVQAASLWEDSAGGAVRVYSPNNIPTKAVIGLGNVTNDAQVKLSTLSEQTMAGELVAPRFSSNLAAILPQHVPRYDQVIPKNTIIDFGTY
ncbi:hypothetical protein fHeYen901_268 [Yersinia phage fHe-Yen9-01]|uniref:Uncharacterized protein n=1 Tax=Yersinia phage fHe-Yen9-01 TaxID=1965363 RepID=A0A1V0DY23_9CAUD|nr:hinge connector of long tail fiber protein distal connector [Yersinia phage fHe-Yen9-01]ARB06041.1 hypothetical protein fHeYen901_268 [Yersinia phage fHe-Yen9-01]